MNRTVRRVAVVALGVLVVVTSGRVASAYWAGRGGGVGSATTRGLDAITVGPAALDSAALHPGATAPVALPLTNPNPVAVNVDSLTAVAITSNKPGCDATTAGVSLEFTDVPPLLSTGTTTVHGTAVMSVLSASACQGARFSAEFRLVTHA